MNVDAAEERATYATESQKLLDMIDKGVRGDQLMATMAELRGEAKAIICVFTSAIASIQGIPLGFMCG